MAVVVLDHEQDFAGWRRAARALRGRGTPPEAVSWCVGGDLFAAEAPPLPGAEAAFTVPAPFMALAEDVVLHRAPERWSLLYRLLWRLERTPELLALHSDPDVRAAERMRKAVSLAAHKMKAFVRFRLVEDAAGETFVAWFEPHHRVTERTAPFFARRYTNMAFSILTPDACVHWDGEALAFTPGVDQAASRT